ncbi:hypothetical protein [Brevundimonas sp.]|uniref:hypothetical protein n=1 Tax=Brevundimonas sp. TaxID=1871086 RepID=UPI0035B2BF1A
MRTLAIVAGALALSACGTMGGETAPPPAGLDLSGGSFTGWVRVTGEEFQLFAEQRDLLIMGTQACVSGALPRNLQRAAGDISGSQVRFFGRTLAWSERNQTQSHDWQGSNIVNGCRKDVVILADWVEVVR